MERSPFFSVYILLRGTLAWSMESYFFRIQQLALYLNPEKPDVPLNKNDAFQKVQKRRVQEKR